MKAYKKIVFVLVIGIAILAQLMNPTLAHADGEQPPLPTDSVTEVALTELPIATESPTVPTEVVPTELPVATETPTDAEIILTDASPTVAPTEPSSSITGSAEPVATEEPTLLEVTDEIPVGTEIVVLDETGQAVPLATQEAADIIANGDPMWCPAGVTIVTANCVNAPTVALLLPLLASKNQDGIIYFYTPSTYNVNDVNFSSINPDIDQLTDNTLTLQGGWNGITTLGSPITFSGQSVFSVPIQIALWGNNITVNNIDVENVSGPGLTIVTSGKVTVNNSNFVSNSTGLQIYSDEATVNNGNFVDNQTGLQIYSSGNVAVNNSNFVDNQTGVELTFWGGQNTVKTLTGNNNTLENSGLGLRISVSCTSLNYWTAVNVFSYVNNTQDYAFGATSCGITVPSLPIQTPVRIDQTISQSQGEFDLSCAGVDGFAVNLSNGDVVSIYCPVKGAASINRVDNTTLPAELPTGYTYASAFKLDILQNEKPIPVITEGGYITASFVAQPLQAGNTYSILYWDNGSWIPLKDFMLDENNQPQIFDLSPGVSGDTRKIIRGVNLVTKRGSSRVEISTNFPGLFVLVQQ